MKAGHHCKISFMKIMMINKILEILFISSFTMALILAATFSLKDFFEDKDDSKTEI